MSKNVESNICLSPTFELYNKKSISLQDYHKEQQCNVACYTERVDSVEDFINRHNVKGNIFAEDLTRKLEKKKIQINTDTFNLSGANMFLMDEQNEAFMFKILKYNRKLNQTVYTLVKNIQNRDCKMFINLLQNNPRPNVVHYESRPKEFKLPDSDSTDDSYNSNNLIKDNKSIKLKTSSLHNVSCEYLNESLSDRNEVIYETDLISYPISSYGRISMLQKEHKLCTPINKTATFKTNKEKVGVNPPFKCRCSKKYMIRKSSHSNLDPKLLENENCQVHSKQDIATSGSVEVLNKIKINENFNQKFETSKHNTPTNVETKIDDLVKSINFLIGELKGEKKRNQNIQSCSYKFKELSKNIIDRENTKSETLNLIKKERVDYADSTTSSVSPVSKLSQRSYVTMKTKTGDGENNMSSKSTMTHDCPQGIATRKPTTDKSVEVTKSFLKIDSKADKNGALEVNAASVDKEKGEKISTEVNTEPMSILALLRVCTETIRQLLSLLPTIDCCSYLSLFQLPCSNDSEETQYVCNICGAAFNKPSMLNDHIRDHDLGFERECCTCRHVLRSDSLRSRKLFKCQFCGQRFTRAYCCELHQQSCAKRLGLPREVNSSLILLR